MKTWMTHQILCTFYGFWNSKLVTQSEGKASFVVIFLLASDHAFIYSLIMNEFLTCAKPWIQPWIRADWICLRQWKGQCIFTQWGCNVCFTLGQENDFVQICLCHLGCIVELSGKLYKLLTPNLLCSSSAFCAWFWEAGSFTISQLVLVSSQVWGLLR